MNWVCSACFFSRRARFKDISVSTTTKHSRATRGHGSSNDGTASGSSRFGTAPIRRRKSHPLFFQTRLFLRLLGSTMRCLRIFSAAWCMILFYDQTVDHLRDRLLHVGCFLIKQGSRLFGTITITRRLPRFVTLITLKILPDDRRPENPKCPSKMRFSGPPDEREAPSICPSSPSLVLRPENHSVGPCPSMEDEDA